MWLENQAKAGTPRALEGSLKVMHLSLRVIRINCSFYIEDDTLK